jgi:hypothetical protein
MIAADDETGLPIWSAPVPRIKSILAATKEKIYCRSLTNRLLAVDPTAGKIVAESAPSLIYVDIVNQLNDRVYLISESGQLTCLRERGKEHAMPAFHEALPVPTEAPKAKPGQPAAPAGESRAATGGAAETVDPFGAALGATDAFGAPATPAAPTAPADADPFATPPAGAAPAAGANPF